jgi:LPXTG-motif cell wall-anchored protein
MSSSTDSTTFINLVVLAIILVTLAGLFFVRRRKADGHGIRDQVGALNKVEMVPRELIISAPPGIDQSQAIRNSKVFISHSSKDQEAAEKISTALENRGLQCWFANRDVNLGENFQESIHRAIRSAKVMVLVFTKNANNSAEINKEVALAGKYELVVIPVRVEDVQATGALGYELATRQWIDLFRDWERAIERLSSRIAAIVSIETGTGSVTQPTATARSAQELD